MAPAVVADVVDATNTTPIVVTIKPRPGAVSLPSHGIFGGLSVDGVLDNTAANGTWLYTNGGPVQSFDAGTPISINTGGSPHGLVTGMRVTIPLDPSASQNPNAIGTWTITVTSPNTFTLNGSGGGTTTPPSGTYCGSYTLPDLPTNAYILVGSRGNGTYAGGGTVTGLVSNGPLNSAVLLP